MKEDLTKAQKSRLNEIKKEIAEIIKTKKPERLDEFSGSSLYDAVCFALNIINLSELTAEHMAIEYALKNPPVFFSVSFNYGKNGFGYGTGNYYNMGKNRVGINLNRCYNRSYISMLGGFICHELCHKKQIDENGFMVEDYNKYEVKTSQDMQALWCKSPQEREASKFAFYYSNKILGRSASPKLLYLRAKNAKNAVADAKYILKGKKMFNEGATNNKKLRKDYYISLSTLKELFSYFDNGANFVLLKDLGGDVKRVKIKDIKQALASSSSEHQVVTNLAKVIVAERTVDPLDLSIYNGVMQDRRYILPAVVFTDCLKEHYSYVKNKEDLNRPEVLTSLLRASFYQSVDEIEFLNGKTLKKEKSGEDKLLDAINGNASIELTKRELELVKKALEKSPRTGDYILYNTQENLNDLLKTIKRSRFTLTAGLMASASYNNIEKE